MDALCDRSRTSRIYSIAIRSDGNDSGRGRPFHMNRFANKKEAGDRVGVDHRHSWGRRKEFASEEAWGPRFR
jgi:hypothetical protein